MILLEYIIFGFAASLALIIVAKVIMATLLQRKTDFYRDEFDLLDEPLDIFASSEEDVPQDTASCGEESCEGGEQHA